MLHYSRTSGAGVGRKPNSHWDREALSRSLLQLLCNTFICGYRGEMEAERDALGSSGQNNPAVWPHWLPVSVIPDQSIANWVGGPTPLTFHAWNDMSGHSPTRCSWWVCGAHAETCRKIKTFFQGGFMSQMTLAGTGSMRALDIITQAPVTQIMGNESTIQETKQKRRWTYD